MYEVQGLHGRHEAVGDAALLQHLQRLGLVEVVGPRAAAVAAQVVLTDADPCAAVLAFGVVRVRVSQNTPSREGRGHGFDAFIFMPCIGKLTTCKPETVRTTVGLCGVAHIMTDLTARLSRMKRV